jgi:hypothetical protein
VVIANGFARLWALMAGEAVTPGETVLPEPGATALLASGILALLGLARRRRAR